MRVLVFGRTGQVAKELARSCPQDVEAIFLGRDEADLTRPEVCAQAVAARKPDLVINAAAYTAVDAAETDAGTAQLVNAESPGAIARAAAAHGIPMLHVSTDYVFDGTGTRPFAPSDPTAPLGVYGRTKLEGEAAIREAGGQAAILRTSWVFSAHKTNFVKTMLRLSETRDRLSIVADQVGGPTPAADIAAALWTMGAALHGGAAGGTWHFSGAPDVSWAQFAQAIFEAAERQVAVEEIPTAQYPTPAQRPLNSRLDCRTTTRDFGLERPDWRAGLRDVLKDMEKAAS